MKIDTFFNAELVSSIFLLLKNYKKVEDILEGNCFLLKL